MRFKFYTKLVSLVSISLLITALVGTISGYYINNGLKQNEAQHKELILPVLYIEEVIQNYRYANSLLLQMVIDKNPEDIQAGRKALDEALATANYYMGKYLDVKVTNPYQQQLMTNVAEKIVIYDVANHKAIEEAMNTTTDVAIARFNNTNKRYRVDLFNNAMAAIRDLRDYSILTIEENNRQQYDTTMNAQRTMFIIMVLSMIVLFLGGTWLAKYVKGTLNKVVDYANAISNNDFDIVLPPKLINSKDEFGDMAKALVCMQSNLRTNIEKLNDSEKAAQSANVAKSNFLSHMSHEMRTPLNAIIGLNYIAKQSNDRDNIMSYLDKIDSTSNHLLGIINDVLDMSKIEAGRLELIEEEFSLEKTLINVCGFIAIRADEKKQNLIIHIDNNVATRFLGDSQRLAQVITNLLGNAIKFSPQNGTIKLSVNLVDSNSLYSTLLFVIEDNGIGITEEQRERLFKPFEQADKTISKNFGGTGLGLAISSRIVELMGGEIGVESQYGEGSRFKFTVRLKNTAQLARTKLNKEINKNNIKILILDDSEDLLDFFSNLFGELKLEVATADTPDKALSLINNASAQGKPFNIMFVDWMMPEIDGITFIKQLKEHYAEPFVSVLISIAKFTEVEQKAIDAGVNRFLSKPIFPSTVINMLNEIFGPSTEGNKILQKTKDIDFNGCKILLVEDVEINRDIVRAYLEPTGIYIDECENGLEAVNKWSANKYDLILMDIQMPVMDGYTATMRIRQLEADKGLPAVPIVAMTANAFREDVEKCLQAGMNDHIAKPISHDVTVSVLSKYLNAGTADTSTEAFESVYINYADALARVLGKKELYVKMLSSFITQASVIKIKEYMDMGDYKKAAFEVHKQKGIAAAVSAVPFHDRLDQLGDWLLEDPAEASLDGMEELLEATMNQAETIVYEIKKELKL